MLKHVLRNLGLAPRVQEAPVAHAVETRRQGVLEEAAHKLHTFNQPGLVVPGITILDTDADVAVLDSEDAPVGDDAPADVAPFGSVQEFIIYGCPSRGYEGVKCKL